MTVDLTLQDTVTDHRGLVLCGVVQGGGLRAGDRLAIVGTPHPVAPIAVVAVEADTVSPDRVRVRVNLTHTALLDVGTILRRVDAAAATPLLPMDGLPPGTAHEPTETAVGLPVDGGPDEAHGSGPGYDAFK